MTRARLGSGGAPVGFARGVFPAGLQFLGIAWSEPILIRLAYAYEQATKPRSQPASVPALPSERCDWEREAKEPHGYLINQTN